MNDLFLFTLICGLIAFVGSALAVPLVLDLLKKAQILDKPVKRSSHKAPTPKGGGWAVIPVFLTLMSVLFYLTGAFPLFGVLACAAVIVMIISWQDDVKPVAPVARFLIQAICVASTIYIFPTDLYLFQGHLPFWLDRALTFWALLWFVNLYNFMDGLDGMTAMQTASIGLGVAALMLLLGVGGALWPVYGFALAGVSLAFMIWNWHPAKVFIGDVGAVTLGLLVGWYLIYFAMLGHFWPACMIGLYYCFDATITLVRRISKGEKPWEPHREFFFQAPVPHKLSHAGVVVYIFMLNIVLFICAFLVAQADTTLEKVPAILASGFAVIALLSHFHGMKEKK